MRILIISIAMSLGSSLMGQTPTISKRKQLKYAEVYVNIKDYYSAKKLLEPLYLNDSADKKINYLLGISNLNLGSLKLSEKQLKAAYNKGVKEALFYLSKNYFLSENFDLARAYLDIYLNGRVNIPFESYQSLNAQINRCIKNYSEEIPGELALLNSKINSINDEYAPIISADGSILFYTTKTYNPDEKNEYIDSLGDEDIYQALNVNGIWQKASILPSPVNSSTHDALVAINKNSSKMWLYRTSNEIESGNLLSSSFENGSWTDPTSFNQIVNSKYQESSICFTNNERVAYFSSDRPGGYGGKDLYRIVLLPNGEWSQAQNLGPNINSPHDEDSPFYNEESDKLYFMSNGHETMGGFDIFYSELDENGIWHNPNNMGYPINTSADDVFFSINESGSVAYFSSNRIGGMGGYDIYEFRFKEAKEHHIVRAKTTLNDSSQACYITIINKSEHKLVGTYNSNAVTGEVLFILKPNIDYQIVIQHKGYRPVIENYFSDPNNGEIVYKHYEIKK